VNAHEDGQQKRLLVRYGRILMEMDLAGQKMTFDSAAPNSTADPIGVGKVLEAMVEKEVKIVVDAKGKVSDVENVEELAAALDQAGVAAAQFKPMFSKEYFSQMVEQASLHNVPPQPVAPGATWPEAFDMNLPQIGRVQIKGTYTFKG
jgi:hypothetical protein